MWKFFRNICTFCKTVIFIIVLLVVGIQYVHSEKFNACGTDSIWSAYLMDMSNADFENDWGDFVEAYYPEEFFSGDGAKLPDFESNTELYQVPCFYFDMPSCDLDSFYIEFRFSMSSRIPVYWRDLQTWAILRYIVPEHLTLDFDQILRSKDVLPNVKTAVTSSKYQDSKLRYLHENVLWFKYKDGVLYCSNGNRTTVKICKIWNFNLTWNMLGGSLDHLYVKIDDKVYEEDFSDCSNAMKYDECPPKEPDFVKVICEEIPDCRKNKYKFYTESSLGEIHWVSLDGLDYEGDKLTLLQEEFNGGCVAVWAQKDPCTEPVYDTICPPEPDIRIKETEVRDTICWSDPLVIAGKKVLESGIYQEIYTASNGCDSIVRYEVKVNTGDTIFSDTTYRCGITKIVDDMFIYDTIEVSGGCPDLEMAPVGKISTKNHVSIRTIKTNTQEVSFDFENNLGNVVYTTVWMKNTSEQVVDKTVKFDKAGMYKIIAYDEETGCKDSIDYYYYTPIKPEICFCPDDSEDSTWDIEGIDKYTNYIVEIFDRFGKKLITFDNEFNGWDGIYNGKPMPSTDYWYSIEVDEGDISLNGHFTLMRNK